MSRKDKLSELAEQYGYDVEKVDIQYFIVKRKLIEDFAYPQKRVQIFEPASGKPTRKKLQMEIESHHLLEITKIGWPHLGRPSQLKKGLARNIAQREA
jgi:hypothetical protein